MYMYVYIYMHIRQHINDTYSNREEEIRVTQTLILSHLSWQALTLKT